MAKKKKGEKPNPLSDRERIEQLEEVVAGLERYIAGRDTRNYRPSKLVTGEDLGNEARFR